MRDGHVEIVDANTGRVRQGTRWEKGLHNVRLRMHESLFGSRSHCPTFRERVSAM